MYVLAHVRDQLPARRPDNETLRALIAAPTLTRRIYNGHPVAGLEARAIQVLIAVELLGRPTVKEVAEELALPHKTVSTLLAKLAGLGMVLAEPDPTDQRRQLQRTTPDGLREIGHFIAQVEKAVE